MKNLQLLFTLLLVFLLAWPATAKKKDDVHDTLTSAQISGLKFRSIGPGYASGRISDFAVNPENHSEYYVGVASGNIWKTTNAGTTFEPVFENYGAYAIGCLEMDPNNPNVLWAGTGENNHQRALGYGDGVYKTMDGGKTWKNMGLKESRHIGMILVDPRDSETVYIAAEGSAWGPGGQRGLYKTTDGGENWEKILEVSEHTGINNVIHDPRDPDVLYATSEQRRRHVHTKIGGGPESKVYKSTDAGENWRKIMSGLPKVHIGGMGIDISPVDPDVLYLIVEAAEDKSGFYRSTDRGESWERRSDHHSSGQYYNEIFCDPKDVDKVYSVETYSHYSEDGGKTFKRLNLNKRHVDDHALWINPEDTDQFIIGGDGGIYITYDAGEHYRHVPNLPVMQFYRVNVDNTKPFYRIYGGTQDNNSLGGPSQTRHSNGIPKGEWQVTLGGDGFWQAIDPENPDIVYSEYQYGNSIRYDRQSDESIMIKPRPRKGEDSYRWNWNAPLIISPHNNTRLYAAANKLFRSDDRGMTWEVISDDLTRSLDRNKWKVMGHYWSYEAVRKDVSTSLYGTIVSLDESRLQEDLIYVGTDDGLIQVTEDADNWRKTKKFPGVPEYTYVSDIYASKHDANVVFATFDNRKRDDFKPYVLKSTDKGKSWKPISGDLPEDETVHTIVQDHINPDILFAGTEFGAYVTLNGGEHWTQLKSGIPTISVRDMAIHEEENALALATFGRGFYILDDYSPLREISNEVMEKEAHIFEIPEALMFTQKGNKYGQGSTEFLGKNPEFGAAITYYLGDSPKTLKQKRKSKEKELDPKEERIPMPDQSRLRDEDFESKPHLIFDISDADGNHVRRLTKAASKGINQIHWNFRYESVNPQTSDNDFNPMKDGGSGMLAVPGEYNVKLSLYQNGEITELTEPKPFECRLLNNRTLPASDHAEMVAFQQKMHELSRVMKGTYSWAKDLKERMQQLRQVTYRTSGAGYDLIKRTRQIDKELDDIIYEFEGRTPPASREENPPAPVALNERLNNMVYTHWRSTSDISNTEKQLYDILADEFPLVLEELKSLYNEKILPLEEELETLKAPYTPGRIPQWNE